MKEKIRLDIEIVNRGLAESREKAKAYIMAGLVYVDNQKADKPGIFVIEQNQIEVRGQAIPYVSRGGLKLEKAINVFKIDLKDKTAMDIGASTGGFTDCMLLNGAKKVYAIDVGYGQLAWKLRNDPKVVVMERTNIRYVTKENIPDEPVFASIDVSFISLKLVLPVVYRLLKSDGEVLALIKPQFEAGREKVGKKGVVRERSVHKEVVLNICKIANDNDFQILGIDFSPIKGPEGNIEYLIYLKKGVILNDIDNLKTDEVIEKSHSKV